MARSTTVRLYPIVPEHFLAMLVDVFVFAVAYSFLPHAETLVFLIVILGHIVQMGLLCAVRFDDTAITIIRPWRVRRIEWTEIKGLIHTYVTSNRGRGYYRLRLVLNDQRDVERGPIVTALWELEPWKNEREWRCAKRIYEELERHGFPPPPPHAHVVRAPRDEAVDAVPGIIESDVLGTVYPVTIQYPDPATNEDIQLALDWLRTRGVTGTARIVDDPGHSRVTYLFHGDDAKGAFDRFLDAAQEQLPAGCEVSVGAPVEDQPPHPAPQREPDRH